MDLKDIGYIIAVSEEQTITRAARSLFISQPALSQAIKRLEHELGCILFIRTGNTMSPTPAGQLISNEGYKLLHAKEKLLADIQQMTNQHRETLHFGISPFYSKYYLPHVFRYYAKHLPSLKLAVVEKASVELENMVASGKLPFCFVPSRPANPALTYTTVGIEEIFLAVPPSSPVNALAIPSSDIPYMDLANVRNEPFILLSAHQKVAELQTRMFSHADFSPQKIYETANWDTALSLINSGLGLGFLPGLLMTTPLLNAHPNFYRILGVDATRFYAIAHKQGDSLPHAAQQLADVVSHILMQSSSTSQ